MWLNDVYVDFAFESLASESFNVLAKVKLLVYDSCIQYTIIYKFWFRNEMIYEWWGVIYDCEPIVMCDILVNHELLQL